MRQVINFNNKIWPTPGIHEYSYLYLPTYSSTSGTVFDSGYYANENTKITVNCKV